MCLYECEHVSVSLHVCCRLGVWSSFLSSKRADTELNTRESKVLEEIRVPNRGFLSVFIELTRYYSCGERE